MRTKWGNILVFIIFIAMLIQPVEKVGAGSAMIISRGIASQYARGVMTEVLHYRVRHGQIPGIITPHAVQVAEMADRFSDSLLVNIPEVTVRPGVVVFGEYDGFVARPWASEIGETVWLRYGDRDWEKFLVTDCGGIADGGQQWMLRNNILVEVDWGTATRWGVIGRAAEVEMSTVNPYDARHNSEVR